MSIRTKQREAFLTDVICAAVEGGTGYWAQVSQYQYEMDNDLTVYCGEGVGVETRATLEEMDGDGRGDLTYDSVASAIGKVARGEAGVNDAMVKRIARAHREADAGDIDAFDADVIAQVAVLGKVVYG